MFDVISTSAMVMAKVLAMPKSSTPISRAMSTLRAKLSNATEPLAKVRNKPLLSNYVTRQMPIQVEHLARCDTDLQSKLSREY